MFSVIWVGQGCYLAINSTPTTAIRNSGILLSLFHSRFFGWTLCDNCYYNLYHFFFSSIVGGLIVYFEFNTDTSNNTYLSLNIINTVYICFSVIALLGVLTIGVLSKPKQIDEAIITNTVHVQKPPICYDMVDGFCKFCLVCVLYTTLGSNIYA